MRRGSWTRSAVALLVLALGACSGDDDATDGDAGADTGEPVPWKMLHQQPNAALLAVWGGGDEIWAVGSRTATDSGPVVLHFDGAAWETLETGLTAVDLWWVYGFEGGPVFVGGSDGAIARYQDGAFEQFETPGNGIVFGIWGASPDDLWAVGGRFNGGGGFAWRFDGSTWTDVPVPDDIVTEAGLLKVAGRSPDDVWMVGGNGAALHWNGSELERADVEVDAPLFSVGATAERIIAVGGLLGQPLIFEHDGASWSDRSPPTNVPRPRGVAATEDAAIAVCESGIVVERGDDGTWTATLTEVTQEDLHGVWITGGGGVIAVGGKFGDTPLRDGVIISRGIDIPEVSP